MSSIDTLHVYYEEHAAQARKHEEQREKATGIIITISGALLGLITFAKLADWSWPAAAGISFLGAYGFLFAGKHYERFRLHASILSKIRGEIEKAGLDSNYQPPSLGTIRDRGESDHYAHFRWPRFVGSNNERQNNARSWIARQRLNIFWEGVHIVIFLSGFGLLFVIYQQTGRPKDADTHNVNVLSWPPAASSALRASVEAHIATAAPAGANQAPPNPGLSVNINVENQRSGSARRSSSPVSPSASCPCAR
jgi:hypothetical protein